MKGRHISRQTGQNDGGQAQTIEDALFCARRYLIGKVAISAVNMPQALAALDGCARRRTGRYVCVANVRTTVLSQRDEEFCRIQNNSLLTLPDGMPLVWAARLAGQKHVGRVTGPDLMLEILGRSRERGYSHYFYGDTQDTLSEMTRTIERRFGDIDIRGCVSPPFEPWTDASLQESADAINSADPTFVWVALGSPKQDLWMAAAEKLIHGAILVGVGAAFRFMIGQYKHPPAFVQKIGLEGFCWRFFSNPWREGLWYCRHVPAYGALMAKVLAARVRGGRA